MLLLIYPLEKFENELWKHFQDKELMRVFDYLFFL